MGPQAPRLKKSLSNVINQCNTKREARLNNMGGQGRAARWVKKEDPRKGEWSRACGQHSGKHSGHFTHGHTHIHTN